MKRKLKIIGGVSVILSLAGLAVGCQKQPSKEELQSQSISRSREISLESYSKYMAKQKSMPKIGMEAFSKLYNSLEEFDDSLFFTSGNMPDSHLASINGAIKSYQSDLHNKYLTKDNIKSDKENALGAVSKAKEDNNEMIDNLKGYRDNKIVKEAISFLYKENRLFDMYGAYIKELSKNPDSADGASLELYKTQLHHDFEKLKKKMVPIIQQANYESSSINQRSSDAASFQQSQSQNIQSGQEAQEKTISQEQSNSPQAESSADVVRRHNGQSIDNYGNNVGGN